MPALRYDDAEFDRFFAQVLAPALDSKESARRDAVRFHHTAVALGIGAGVVLGVPALFLPIDELFKGLALAGPIFAGVAFGQVGVRQVKRDVKDLLLAPIAEFAGAQYSQDVDEPPAIDVFRALKLLPSYDRSAFEDLFQGARAGCEYQLYEAHLEVERRDNKGGSSYDTVFRGQLLRIRFPKSFLGVTVVLRDAGLFNRFSNPGEGLQRVGLVDPTFEKVFEVFGSDQVEARFLLTPTFMERLLALETLLHGKKARAAFSGGDLIIAVEGGDLFEPGSMFEPLVTPERAWSVYADLLGVHAIIDSLLAPETREAAI